MKIPFFVALFSEVTDVSHQTGAGHLLTSDMRTNVKLVAVALIPVSSFLPSVL
jgi:hypothetical protein